jgi:hypothetical protein
MNTLKERLLHIFIISIFCGLYFLVATISMINSVAFFDLSHSGLMSWSLAIGFEIGAAASLAAIIILEKTNKSMVWGLFLLLTSFQMMANSFHAFINLEDYMGWIQLFGLEESEPLFQKRILSIVSGAILPLVALGFIKSLVDYVRPVQDDSSDDFSDLDVTLNDGLEVLEEEDISEEVEENTVLVVDEEQPIEDLYSRDATTAHSTAVIGEVHVAPEIVNTVVDVVEEPINTEQYTPVGDPIIIPTNSTPSDLGPKKPQLVSRPFVRSVESKP